MIFVLLVAQWIALKAYGQCVVGSGSLVVSGRASDHNYSCAPKPAHIKAHYGVSNRV